MSTVTEEDNVGGTEANGPGEICVQVESWYGVNCGSAVNVAIV